MDGIHYLKMFVPRSLSAKAVSIRQGDVRSKSVWRPVNAGTAGKPMYRATPLRR
jgi:hypothetical protein